MKKEYPNYSKGFQDLITKSMKPKDKIILKDFLDYCKISAGEKKIKNIQRTMLQIFDVSEIGYNDWDLKLLRAFLVVLKNSNKSPATRNDIKKVLKRFLIEQYKDSSERFNRFRDIKTENANNIEKINPDTIPTAKEVEELVRRAESLRWRSLIYLLYETGARPSEILTARWEDLDLEKGEVKLRSTKNKTLRYLPLKDSIIHLKRHHQEFTYSDVTKKDYLYPSPTKRDRPLSLQSVNNYFRELGTRAIKKHFFAYMLRHLRSTELISKVKEGKLNPLINEKFMDHSFEVAKKTYEHMSKDEVRKAMFEEIYKIKELTPQQREDYNKQIVELKKTIGEDRKMFLEITDALGEDLKEITLKMKK